MGFPSWRLLVCLSFQLQVRVLDCLLAFFHLHRKRMKNCCRTEKLFSSRFPFWNQPFFLIAFGPGPSPLPGRVGVVGASIWENVLRLAVRKKNYFFYCKHPKGFFATVDSTISLSFFPIPSLHLGSWESCFFDRSSSRISRVIGGALGWPRA